MTDADLSQQLASLAEGFSRLGARASQAAKELQDSGVPPPDGLLEELAASWRDFADLRARVVDLAAAVAVSPPRRAGEIACLKELEALLGEVAEAKARAAAEETRQRAVGMLDRVLELVHRDDPDYPQLPECQDKARELRDAIAAAAWKELPQDAAALAAGTHPFAAFLTLVESAQELDDAQWEALGDTVADAFGKTLAGAASRRKLVNRADLPPPPPPVEEVAEAPSPAELAAPPVVTEAPEVAVEAPPAPVEAPPEPAVAVETPLAVEATAPPVTAPVEAPVVEEPKAEEAPRPPELSVVYLELRGYTQFAETAKPEVVMAILNEYHTEMGKLILSHEGSLERIIGDGMVIAFKAPVEKPSARAVRMSLEMRDRIGEMITRWRKRGYKLNFCVGIEQATLAGDTNDDEAVETVGDLASILCREGKLGQILVRETSLEAIKEAVEVEPAGTLKVQGAAEPITAYNIVRLKG